MRYFLDFDRTLLDTDALKTEQVAHHGQERLGTVESLLGIDISEFLFQDALDFLRSHNASDICIVSSCHGITGMWDPDYQKEKISQSGVAKFVDSIHMVADQKSDIIRTLHTNEPAVFVDDLATHLVAVRSACPDIVAVRMARPHTLKAASSEKQDVFPAIASFSELDAILGII